MQNNKEIALIIGGFALLITLIIVGSQIYLQQQEIKAAENVGKELTKTLEEMNKESEKMLGQATRNLYRNTNQVIRHNRNMGNYQETNIKEKVKLKAEEVNTDNKQQQNCIYSDNKKICMKPKFIR